MKKLSFYINVLSLIYMTTFPLFPLSSSADPLDDWFTVTTSTNDLLYGVAYGNNTFVAVGANGTILTSTDGIIWTPRTSRYTTDFLGVGYDNGYFVIVGIISRILISTDGIVWYRGIIDTGPYSDLYGVTCNGRCVAVGDSGTILSSLNGGPWIHRYSGTNELLYGTTYENGIFVAVGEVGTTLYSTTEGVSWSPGNSPISSYDIRGVAYGNYIFVAVGDSGTILNSLNGVIWTVPPDLQNPLPSVRLRGVTYCRDTFIAVGDSGTILTSLDGVNWTARTSGTSYNLEAAACDPNSSTSVVVGEYGTILLSGVSGVPGIPPLPVRIERTLDYFSSIQAAYDAPTIRNGDIIQSRALHFSENLLFDSNVTVTIKGGYDSTYTTNPSSTTINGSLTISDGTVEVENIVIK